MQIREANNLSNELKCKVNVHSGASGKRLDNYWSDMSLSLLSVRDSRKPTGLILPVDICVYVYVRLTIPCIV